MKPLIGITPQYDSEHNRIKIERAYYKAITQSGGIPIILPLYQKGEELQDLLHVLDGVLFSGGPDVAPHYFKEEPIPECGSIDRYRDALEQSIMSEILKLRLPVLGICRGIQSINIAMGGTIYQDIPAQYHSEIKVAHSQKSSRETQTHHVNICPNTCLSRMLKKDQLLVNSFHHQAVCKVADGLTVAATAPDGIIEAVTMEDHPFFLGVQWHPEDLYEEQKEAQIIFNEFILAASMYHGL